MALSQVQVNFLERYVVRSGPGNVRAATGPAPNAQQDRQKDASKLLGLAAEVDIPEGATPEEREQIVQGRGAISGLLTETVTDTELRAAAQMVLDLRETKLGIQAAVEERAAQDLLRREEECRVLKAEVRKLLDTLDEDVPEPRRTELTAQAGEIEKSVPTTPTDEQLGTGRSALDNLRRDIEAANTAAEEDRTRRAEMASRLILELKALPGTIDRDVPELDQRALASKAEVAEQTLSGLPDDTVLSAAELAVAEIAKEIEEANGTAEAARKERIERAEQIAGDAAEVSVEYASEAETQELVRLAGIVTDALPADRTRTSDDDIKAAETALRALREEADKIGEAVGARLVRVEQAIKLIDAVKWGEGALQPDAGASPDAVEPLKTRAEAIPTDHVDMRDRAKAHEWGEPELTELTEKIKALETDVEGLNTEVARALEELRLAATAAEAAITSSPGHALSTTQQDSLRDLINPEVEGAQKDVAGVPAAVAALKKLAEKAAALAKSLDLINGRIGRVDGTPAEALPSELTVLADARKKALDALGKVDP